MHQLKGKKPKRVLLLCPYPEGVAPGQRLKYEQYFTFLAAQGYEITVSPFFSLRSWNVLYRKGHFLKKVLGVAAGYARRIYDLARTPFFDGTYVFLHAAPFGGPGLELLFRALSRRMIYDIDDLVYLRPVSRVNPLFSWLRSPRKYSFLMSRADHVITCTPYLDSHVRMFNQRTTDISSTIRTNDYLPHNRYRNDGRLVIGWSGSHSTVPYLNLLKTVLQRVAKERPFTLRVIGTSSFAIEGVHVECVPWREATEVNDLQAIDVGLYPLPNEEWVLGKSGLKALQYMALGIPTVATAIGTNFRVVEHGHSGFLVTTEQEWFDTILRLIDDAELRRTVGAAARKRVENLYSVQANQQVYLSVFDQVFSPGVSA